MEPGSIGNGRVDSTEADYSIFDPKIPMAVDCSVDRNRSPREPIVPVERPGAGHSAFDLCPIRGRQAS
jgi:hypothetical protein